MVIRPYRASDRAGMHQLAADTAFFGEPAERFLEDRQLFCDIMFGYYTDYEPELAWVATGEEQIIGFLVGSRDTAAQQRTLATRIMPAVLWRLARGRYRTGPLVGQWLRRLVSSALRQDITRADLTAYPAHLHIGVDARWQGQGIGRQLMTRYFDQLRTIRTPGVPLRTTDHNTAACRLYERLGMQLLDARPTRLWTHVLAAPVESRCYGLLLNGREQPAYAGSSSR